MGKAVRLLAIDTSNHTLTVAVSERQGILAEYTAYVKRDHSTKLMPAIEQVLTAAEIAVSELEAIVVADGPGSYTGVRIGVTTAKTMSWSLGIPLYTVSSLESLAYNLNMTQEIICPFIDARRGLVFTGLYESKGEQISCLIEDQNISFSTWLGRLKSEVPATRKIIFISPDLEVYKDEILSELGEQALFASNYISTARATSLCLAYETKHPQSIHEVAPRYLRLSEAEVNWQKQQEGRL